MRPEKKTQDGAWPAGEKKKGKHRTGPYVPGATFSGAPGGRVRHFERRRKRLVKNLRFAQKSGGKARGHVMDDRIDGETLHQPAELFRRQLTQIT